MCSDARGPPLQEAALKAGRQSLTGGDDDDRDTKRKKKEEAKQEEPSEENQKFGLVEGLLHIGAIEKAEELVAILEPLHPLHDRAITTALRGIVAEMIEPLYRQTPPGQLAILLPEKQPAPSKLALKSYDELPSKLFPLLKMLGHYLSEDIKDYCKVARILKDYTRKVATGDAEKEEQVLKVVSFSLLPSLTFFDSNPAAVQETWDVIKAMSYQCRFQAYGNFRVLAFQDNPPLIEKKGELIVATKKSIKRLTKDNSKHKGKELAKFSHSNPMEVCALLLNAAKAYENMIAPVVDACKYFSSLAFDMMSYVLMSHLVGSFNSSKLKEDGQNVAGWLMNLASLTGSLFQKYTTNIELPALLLYVACQLRDHEVLDMFVLKNLLQKSGVESMEEGSNQQINTLGGGPVLRSETTFAEQMKLTKKTATRMRDSLLREGNLAVPLYILLCQAREYAIYHSDFGSLKLLSELADKCRDTLIQYTYFMHAQCSSDAGFRQSIPAIKDLLTDFKLPAEAAFFLRRPYTFPNGYYTIIDSADVDNKGKVKEGKKNDLMTPPAGALGEVLAETTPDLEGVPALEDVWKVMDKKLYCTFWNLSSYDIHVPTGAYEHEIKRQKAEIKRIEHEMHENRNMGSSETKKKEKEKKGFIETAAKLEDELKRHKAHYNDVKKRLVKDNAEWIPEYSEDFAYVFLQHCIFPRCVFTAPDASYCIRFCEMMHNNSVSNFSTLHFLSTVFDSIHGVLFKCTEAEASRFGRFLLELFTMMEGWRVDSDVYKHKCAERRGFCIDFGNPSSKKAGFKDYLAVLFKWHQKLARAVVASLDSTEYLEKRNALIVLTKLVKVFPRIKAIFQVIEKKVASIVAEEEREDLKLLGKRYATMLEQVKPSQISNESFKGESERPQKAKAKAPPVEREAAKEDKREAKRNHKEKEEEQVAPPPKRQDRDAEEKERALREGAIKSVRTTKAEGREEEGRKVKREGGNTPTSESKRARHGDEDEDRDRSKKEGSKKEEKKLAKAEKKEEKAARKEEKREKREEERGGREDKRVKEEPQGGEKGAREDRPTKRIRTEPERREPEKEKGLAREGHGGGRDGGREGGAREGGRHESGRDGGRDSGRGAGGKEGGGRDDRRQQGKEGSRRDDRQPRDEGKGRDSRRGSVDGRRDGKNRH